MINKIYLIIRYFAILSLIFILVGIFKIEPIGWWMIFYYIALNYLCLKYGIIDYCNRREIAKEDYMLFVSIFIFVLNVAVYLLNGFSWIERIILSIMPVFELYFMKSEASIKSNTKKEMEEYFSSRKEE